MVFVVTKARRAYWLPPKQLIVVMIRPEKTYQENRRGRALGRAVAFPALVGIPESDFAARLDTHDFLAHF
jgi:hypothetical protein